MEDFLRAGATWFYAHVIDHIGKTFVISQIERVTFKYLGLKIQQSTYCFEIHQKDYIKDIEAIKIDNPSQMIHVLIPHQTQQLKRVPV